MINIKKLRQLRTEKGLSQHDLARKIDVTDAYIGHIERGDRVGSLKTIKKIADALEVDINELL